MMKKKDISIYNNKVLLDDKMLVIHQILCYNEDELKDSYKNGGRYNSEEASIKI